MDMRLPIPKNWQDFESICHRLWAEIWNDPNTQKNGRQGQPQAGVDIFGRLIYTSEYQGVQCKDKNTKLGSVLTKEELITECEKAVKFQPRISNFTLATTTPRDERLQEFYRQLNQKRELPFEVSVWSWDDIESEIIYRPKILQHYYPLLNTMIGKDNKIKLNRYSTKEHLDAFFSRPELNAKMSKRFKSFLRTLILELADNAYLHGKGTLFEIEITTNEICLIDNGSGFNPLTQLDATKVSAASNVGSYVLKTFLQQFKDHLTASYSQEDGLNKLVFITNGNVFMLDDDSRFEFSVDFDSVYGREAVKQLVKDIPDDKTDILINVNEVGALSSFIELTRETLNKLTPEQTLTLSLPRHEYLNDIREWFDDSRLRIHTR
jgi:hypothetical protein